MLVIQILIIYNSPIKIVDNARKHILESCRQLLDQRQSMFKTGGKGNFETGYFAPDLVNLKYDNRSNVDASSRWIEDGEHFNHTTLIAKITDKSTTAVNILVEVRLKKHIF
jgi:hypothetical protein